VNHEHTTAECLHQIHLMRRKDNRLSAGCQFLNYLDQGTKIDRVEPGERLVKNEDLGLSCHGGDKLDLLLITFRQFLDLVVFDVEHVQALQPMERTRPRLVMTHTFQLHEVLYDILNFLPRVESALFWQIANASLV